MNWLSRFVSGVRERRGALGFSLKDLDNLLDLAAMGGTPSSAGFVVTAESALRHVVVFRCVSLIASAVACLPLKVYKGLKPKGKEEAKESAVYGVLHDKPNPIMTAPEYRMAATAHLCLRGNHYSQIIRNGRGEVAELWPLNPDKVEVWLAPDGRELRYLYAQRNGEKRPFQQKDILHLRNVGNDGIMGYSTITMGANTVGLSLLLDKHQGFFYRNNARLGVVLKSPKVLSDDAFDRFTKRWNKSHGGAEKSGSIAILEEGLEFATTLGISQHDAQTLETMKLTRGDIALLFGVPPHMVGDTEKSTSWGTGIEQQTLGFHTFTLSAYLRLWEARCNASLFTNEEQKRGLFVEHVLAGLLRGDIKTRSEALDIWRRNGIISADEWRDLENLNPREDEHGKDYWMPVNYSATGSAVPALTPVPAPLPPQEPKAARALEAAYVAAWERALRRARQDHALVIKKKRTLEVWLAECMQYAHEQLDPLDEAMRALGEQPGAWGEDELRSVLSGSALDALARDAAHRAVQSDVSAEDKQKTPVRLEPGAIVVNVTTGKVEVEQKLRTRVTKYLLDDDGQIIGKTETEEEASS